MEIRVELGPANPRPGPVSRARAYERRNSATKRVLPDARQSKKPLRNPRKPRRLPHFLSTEDIGRLLTAPPNSNPMGLRDRAILELFYASGLRLSELVGLDLDDVNLSGRVVRVLGKGAERVSNWETSSGSFKYDYFPAILLADAQNSYLHATMLLETGTYSESKIFEIMLGEKSRDVELTTLEAEGEDYELVKFKWLALSREKTQ